MAEGIILSMILTSHVGWENKKFNDVHPSIAYQYKDYSVGAYLNSLNHTSLFVSKTSEYDDFSVQYGLTSNYNNRVVPMLVARKPVVEHVNFVFVPSYDTTTKKPAAVFGLEVQY